MHVCQTDPSGVRQEMVISHCNKEDYKDLPTLGALNTCPKCARGWALLLSILAAYCIIFHTAVVFCQLWSFKSNSACLLLVLFFSAVITNQFIIFFWCKLSFNFLDLGFLVTKADLSCWGFEVFVVIWLLVTKEKQHGSQRWQWFCGRDISLSMSS